MPRTRTATTTKAELLSICEANIEQGFFQAGQAFKQIRDSKLYSTTYGSGGFEAYCRKRWKMDRRQVNRIIQASEMVTRLGVPRPQLSVSHLTKTGLADLPLEEQREVIAEAGEKATVEELKAVVNAYRKSDSRPTEDIVADSIAHDVCKALQAEVELKQEQEVGITYQKAKKKVLNCWQNITKGENEKAAKHLAYVFVDFLFKIYPDLQDQPFES